MVDAHVHLERGPYSLAWLGEFVAAAQRAGVTELYLLEHTHRFKEFRPLYDAFAACDDYQAGWLRGRMDASLAEYQALVRRCRTMEFPLRLRFGLEVCWDDARQDFLRERLAEFDWDFLTGSVHWIDGWGFDHRAESWRGREVDGLYRRYYASMRRLAESGLFDHLAHPDSIKCFGHRPSANLDADYAELAAALVRGGMKAEFSAGLANNYGHGELGPSAGLLAAFRAAGVGLVTASDAHEPAKVGRRIRDCLAILKG